MSLPVLHSAAGYGFYRASKKQQAVDFLFAAACVLLANMPDFDFLPGILAGKAAAFHRGATHSFFAALVCGTACAWFFSKFRSERFRDYFPASFGAYVSHLVLDLFGRAPKGLMLFWPFSKTLHYGPLTDFSINIHDHPLERANGFASFFAALAEPGMIHTLCFELTLVFFFWSLAALFSPPAQRRERETLAFCRLAIAAVFFATSVLAG
ncbi:MAG TPA: metal-dependent hydrolase [Verrucomicrobiae bacterium]|jgi:hypothetical protein|nr:metal-dependent hydrolase [Verrucomicrobiae bacterium]